MSKTSQALDLASDLYSMAAFADDDVLELPDGDQKFYEWAIQEHAAYACNELGCDRDTFAVILADYMEYQNHLENVHNTRDNHLEIALGMFRYYIQAYRRRVAK